MCGGVPVTVVEGMGALCLGSMGSHHPLPRKPLISRQAAKNPAAHTHHMSGGVTSTGDQQQDRAGTAQLHRIGDMRKEFR